MGKDFAMKKLLILSVVLAAFCLPARAADDSLQKVLENGVLRVGAEWTCPGPI